jgi:hypothetical protein
MISDGGWICEPEDARHESWMSDAPWLKANTPKGHVSTPKGHVSTVRHKAGVAQIFDHLAFVKSGQLLAQVFYGNAFDQPDDMMGLSARYSTRDQSKAQNADWVHDAGGAFTDLTSVWLLGWGQRTIFMVTPDGLPPPISGEVACVVADFRYAVRIANVQMGITGEKLSALMLDALWCIPRTRPDPDKCRLTFYMRPELERLMPSNFFRGVFVRSIALRDNESRVV